MRYGEVEVNSIFRLRGQVQSSIAAPSHQTNLWSLLAECIRVLELLHLVPQPMSSQQSSCSVRTGSNIHGDHSV